MKRLLIGLAFLFLLGPPGFATDLTLDWDDMPDGEAWTEVRLYEYVNGEYIHVGTTTDVNGPMTITGVGPGLHRYVARAWNGEVESGNSNEAWHGALIAPPVKLTITGSSP